MIPGDGFGARRTGTDVHEFLKDLGEESYLEERNGVKAAGYASCYFFIPVYIQYSMIL